MSTRVVTAYVVLVCLFASSVVAQRGRGGPSGGGPPGGGFPGGGFPGGGGPPGGGFPGGGFPGGGGPPGRGGPGGGFDPTEMLRRMDTNNNGMLDKDEVSDRARGFIERMAEGSGIDTKGPISIDKLRKAMDDRRREREREYQRDDDRRRDEERKKEEEKVLEVQGFELDEEYPLVPGFDLPADSPLLAKGPLESRYDKEILERVERAFRYYDRNKDGILDKEEIRQGRWSDDPYSYDLNKDGQLNKVELCERYAKRYGNEKAKSSKRGSSSRSSSSSSNSSSASSSRSSYTSYRSSGGSSSDRSSGSSSNTSRYAESIMRRYDRNRNGTLERDEWKYMSNSPEKSDKNNDGKISQSELEDRLKEYSSSGGSRSSSSSKSKKSSRGSGSDSDYRFTTLEERLDKLGVSGSSMFLRNDKNGDGQLQMAEFAYSWSPEKIDEFNDYDLNGDGVITPQEWVTVEKEK